jgi:hypothetical protein
MENQGFIEKTDSNGVVSMVNPNYIDAFEGTEIRPEVDLSTIYVPTEEDMARDTLVMNSLNGKKYLAETDWYVSRKVETGVEIPSEVLTKRAQARIDASN